MKSEKKKDILLFLGMLQRPQVSMQVSLARGAWSGVVNSSKVMCWYVGAPSRKRASVTAYGQPAPGSPAALSSPRRRQPATSDQHGLIRGTSGRTAMPRNRA